MEKSGLFLVLFVLLAGAGTASSQPLGDLTEFQGSFYLASPKVLSFRKARMECQKMGGDLAKITTDAENDFVYFLSRKHAEQREYMWIGLHHAPNNKRVFHWLDGSAANFTKWAPTEPNGGECEPCALFRTGFPNKTWLDIACEQSNDEYQAGFVCEMQADSCSFWKDMGFLASGPRLVDPDGSGPIETFCDQETDGGGWAVIQRRIAPFGQDFNTSRWNEYVKGFGNLSGEFWIGLENIYRLVKNGAELRIHVMKEGGPMKYASYGVFSLAGACWNYKWHLESFNGTLTNAIYRYSWPPHNQNNMPFTTWDRDNDNCKCTCANGWWLNHCGYANLNDPTTPYWEGTGSVYSAMMVRSSST